jgi:hypothetical protein
LPIEKQFNLDRELTKMKDTVDISDYDIVRIPRPAPGEPEVKPTFN